MTELANIAGPAVIAQHRHRVRIERRERLAVTRRVMREEMTRERPDVVAAIAKRWQVDDDGVEAIQEVFAEAARRDFFLQVRVGSRQYAGVHVAQPRRSDALHFTRLQHPQQLRLQAHGHVGDLVEKQRAFVGHLEASDAVDARVGEGALDVAEQLALRDAFGEPTRIHRDERLAAPIRERMKPGRDHFLPGAVFAGDEHARVRWRDALDRLPDPTNARRLADERGGRSALPRVGCL